MPLLRITHGINFLVCIAQKTYKMLKKIPKKPNVAQNKTKKPPTQTKILKPQDRKQGHSHTENISFSSL